jgi:signal transduction histidine kinase
VGTTTAADVDASVGPHGHLVCFYETETYLVDSVTAFLEPVLADDGMAIVIATSAHRAAFRSELVASGLDVVCSPRYLEFDAATTLASISEDGRVLPEWFRTRVSQLLAPFLQAGRPIRVYGEMVALLWERGDVADALDLERLWNGFEESGRFELLCGYPTGRGGPDVTTDAFLDLCAAHAAIIPSDGFADHRDARRRRRAMSVLQEHALQLATEREQLRNERDDLQRALDDLASVDRTRREFAAMAVHDIGNPTTVVTGVVELLRQRWSDLDEGQVEQLLGTAARNTSRIQRLLEDILLLARLDSGQFGFHVAPLRIDAAIREVVPAMAESTGRTIDVQLPDRLPRALADEDRQVQILTNLLSNATKFSSDGTTVSVRVEDHGGHLRVAVHDEGSGIAADDLPRLFKPFSRLRREPSAVAGSGLGLVITKALVEGQGGTIEVTSTPGAGSTFAYTVPTAPRS